MSDEAPATQPEPTGLCQGCGFRVPLASCHEYKAPKPECCVLSWQLYGTS